LADAINPDSIIHAKTMQIGRRINKQDAEASGIR